MNSGDGKQQFGVYFRFSQLSMHHVGTIFLGLSVRKQEP